MMVVLIGMLLVAVAGLLYVARIPVRPPHAPASTSRATTATAPSTSPSTGPTTGPATGPSTRLIDVLVAADPRFRGANPLKDPITIEDGAQVILKHPAYIDFRGDLWVTDPSAPLVRDLLKTAGDETVHITRDEVVWVRWVRDNRGNWVCNPVTRDGNAYVWHAQDRAIPMARGDYRFDALVLLTDDRLIVPTEEGVTLIRPPAIRQPASRRSTSVLSGPTSTLDESFAPIPGTTPTCAFATPDGKIALALRPWDNGDAGSDGVLRLGSNGWVPMPEGTCPRQPIHVFFMTDGSLQFVSLGDDGGIAMSVELPLEPTPVNTGLVEKLVETLNDPNEVLRDAAEDAIARFGPSAWPVLERLRAAQTPEGQRVIDHLLGARLKKTLGIFSIVPGPVRIAGRTSQGALALLASNGVTFLDNETEVTRAPALLIDRPGRPVFLAHESAIEKRDPDTFRVQMLNDDVLTTDPLLGVLRHMGNHYSAMLRPRQRDFTVWLGQDRESRWVFRDPKTGDSLLLDPNFSDPAPRLPTWTLVQGSSGYDDKDHPAVERDANPETGNVKSLWQLDESGWRAIDGKTNHFHVEAKPRPASARLPDGTQVSADLSTLLFRRRGTPATTQPIPPEAYGVDPPALIFAAEHLFLFNGPGRVTRFSRDAKGTWALDATFTAEIPTGAIRRIWLDPFGRICIASEDGKLTILFPDGQIPSDLADLIHPNK